MKCSVLFGCFEKQHPILDFLKFLHDFQLESKVGLNFQIL